MKLLNRAAFALIVSLFSLTGVGAADLAREKRMADEIVDTILDGDAVYLKANEHEFLSVYTEADEAHEAARGIVIILHGRGFHPDWQDVVSPLRVGLAESGWNTLSVQMPVLEKEAKYYDYVPLFPKASSRIDAAIAYAREQVKYDKGSSGGGNKIVLIGHSCGAHMAMAWADADSFESIDAYVGIGMGATDYQQPMKRSFPLSRIKVPVLDVYAQNDFPAVLRTAATRLSLIKAAGNQKSAQIVVNNAEHYFVDKGDVLTQVINEWLQSL